MAASPLLLGSAPCWRLHHAEAWVQESIPPTTFLFNARSGQTHLLQEMAVELLEALRLAPATLEELLQRLELEDAEPALRARLLRLLRDLEMLGLVISCG